MRNLLIISTSALLLAACGGSGSSDEPPGSPKSAAATEAAAGNRVEIKAFQFKPDPIEVKAGDKVTFVNLDGTVHTVTSKKAGFDEELDGKESEATITFDEPGTVDYVCTIHTGPGMRGQVVVR